MTTEHPYAEILRAVADGRQAQALSYGQWVDFTIEVNLPGPPGAIRIKPRPSVRVAEVRGLFGRTKLHVVTSESGEAPESKPGFVRWLTDWVEYEVSE